MEQGRSLSHQLAGVEGRTKGGRRVLDMCRMHTESAMLLGQVAAGEVAVGLEGVRQEISRLLVRF